MYCCGKTEKNNAMTIAPPNNNNNINKKLAYLGYLESAARTKKENIFDQPIQ